MRLIDADKLSQKIDDINDKRLNPDDDKAWFTFYGIKNLINEQPSINAVEVVFCADCIYHNSETHYVYCRRLRINCPNDSEFFCKYGKRS